jgi:hypothetical protein
MACECCNPAPKAAKSDGGLIAFSLSLLLLNLLLTGASFGMVGLWLSSGFCSAIEYDIFFGLWMASLVAGLTSIAVAWNSQARALSAFLLAILFGWIMLWVEFGHLVVAANCPG